MSIHQSPDAADATVSPGAAPAEKSLEQWLAHCEALHGDGVVYTLERSALIRRRLGLAFEAPVISVAGTNGKGSTCAMLEAVALSAGYRVGVFSKPHLVNFEERCRINGQPIAAEELARHFAAVEEVRGDVGLGYFEFTFLAIARALSMAPLDLVILEVGLGGRLDAVNVFDADCAVITSIDLDHTQTLGPDRESIGREKAGILRPGAPAIIADPVPPQSVVTHAEQIGADVWLQGRDFNFGGDRQQWAWAGRGRRYNSLAYPALRGANQLLNASAALAALEALRWRLPITSQAVRTGLATAQLPGRFQIVPGQPALVLDVAHNPQAASVLARNLDQMGFFPRTLAVFGAMQDKDIRGIVQPLAPLVDAWYCTALPLKRAASPALLQSAIQAMTPARSVPVTLHDTPALALAKALGEATLVDRIIVFGSFLTVGGVMKEGLPKLGAAHIAST
jgi:dihydrofolate synthase / folylpolyglutamate synthase